MHGKEFILERAYAGINDQDFFLRLDLATDLHREHTLDVRIEVLPASVEQQRKAFIARFRISAQRLLESQLILPGHSDNNGSGSSAEGVEASFEKMLRARIPLALLGTQRGDTLLMRSTLLREELPIDSLPSQGWMELPVIAEEQMLEAGDQVW